MGDTERRAKQKMKRKLHKVDNRNFRQLISNSIANKQKRKKKR